jgi:two-component system, LytTR family, sensor kinase
MKAMRKVVEVVLHLILWFIVLVVYPYSLYATGMSHHWLRENSFFEYLFRDSTYFSHLCSYLAGFYITYLTVSWALNKKLIVRYLVYLSYSILIGVIFLLYVKGYIIYILFTSSLVLAISGGLFAAIIKGIIYWLLEISEKMTLQKRQLKSENALLLLKAQLNPHFLFNSLNNIDILIEESPKIASEYLKKLSDILRYVLYETKEDETTLAREIEQISNYIELQRIRTANASYVDFEVVGDVGERKIVPMIFLPFIENAFKFSKNKYIEKAIAIRFEIDNDSVRMSCKNFYEPHYLNVIKNEGLGIETIRQRLKLLYPGKHDLEILDAENWFTVSLKISF